LFGPSRRRRAYKGCKSCTAFNLYDFCGIRFRVV
jgi:hypothetical protein